MQGQHPLSPPRVDRKAREPLQGAARQALRKAAMVCLYATLPSLLFYTYLSYSETGRTPRLQENPSGFAVAILAGLVIGGALYTLNRILDRFIPWMSYFSSRFLLGFILNIIVGLSLVIALATASINFWDADLFWNNSGMKDPDVTWKIVILTVVFVFIYNVLHALLYAYQHYAVAQIQELKRERKQLELQFEALKGQISPHYLFNSLNTISSLILKDIQSAEQFIRRLAETYQYVLSTQNKRYVSLREELDFVQSYYYLLRIRFQQQIHIEINIPAKILNTKIPPLTLQMLVENAVKHNTFTGEEKMLIYIMAEDNTYLKVINTKTGIIGNAPSFKMGLDNIRQRYHFLTDKQVVVENKDKFIVSLPVLTPWEREEERKNSA